MDRNHSNLGRPPPKLRYFKSNERPYPCQTANVRNIEDCFELDSSSDAGSELSALSPLTKTLSEDSEVLGIMLLPVTETSESPLCSEKNPSENPSEEFVPEKVSSPLGLATEDSDGHGDGRARASPLLFEIEGEVPESGSTKIAQSKTDQLTRKDFDESSESELESPPKKIVLEKRPKVSTDCKEKIKESWDYDCEPSTTPVKSKDCPNLGEMHGNNIVSSEVKPLEEGRECSAFVLKLKDTGRSKSIGFRKETSPVPASHLEADEDFLILEDEILKSPRWFSFPKRTELKRNKLPHEDNREAVKHNKEGNAADENHSSPQNSKNKEKHSKGTKCKKTNAVCTVDQKTERKRVKSADERPLDIPATVQSKTTQNCLEGQENVVGHTERDTADVAEEDDVPVLLPSACSASDFEINEQADKKNKRNEKQKEKCPKVSRKKPVNQKKGEVAVPSSRPVTDVAPEGQKRGKRKRPKPEVLGLPEECEKRVVNGGDVDLGHDPSPYPDRHHAPTPEKKQKKSKEKQRRRHLESTVNHETDRVDTSPIISENETQQKGHEPGRRQRQKPGSWWLVNQEERAGSESQREVPAWHKQPGRRSGQSRQSAHQNRTSCAPSPLLEKQQRTVPHNQLCKESEGLVKSSLQLSRQKPVKKRTAKVLPKPHGALKSSQKAFQKSDDILSSAMPRLTPRNVRTSLASFGSIFTSGGAKTTTARHSASRKTVGLPIAELPSWEEQYVPSRPGRLSCDYCQGAGDYLTNDQNACIQALGTEPREGISPKYFTARSPSMTTYGKQTGGRNLAGDNRRFLQFDQLQSEVDVCKGFKSGPSSMIEVDERTMPSSQNAPHVLSEFQMCGAPLKPIALQVEDREDLVKWLKNVWSSPDGAEIITPEHFQWYAYRGRAMGFRSDLLYETFSNGKILLGSYMNKPLQVDNNAIYVYNILTSTVCVTINGVKKELSSGETFMIPCGHAYGMRNLTAEPAVLLYHRMVAESPDSG
ncbi:hypothetical protein COCON_G00065980 [Conger conger]|uniref:Mif2/CENP-C cupin domain-containing protein n=1 Tax=Conger conger TaxID=82655 RepID=A0A9Q1DSC0_CONCO|nr:hypothetical protein COCON_G00065980 [Conger conger]